MPSPTVDYILGDALMHSHGAGDITDLTTTLDPRYLKLNQSTPQTITTSPIIDNLTGSKVVFSTSDKKLTSTGIGTSAQFIKADGSLDSSTYLTSFTEADTLASVTGRGATTTVASTFSTSISTPSLISTGAIGITPASGSNLNISLATTGDLAVNTNQLYVDTSAGKVGIGTTNPGQPLHIKAAATGGLLRLEETAANGYASIDMYGSDGLQKGGFGYGGTTVSGPFADKIYFYGSTKDLAFSVDQGTSAAMFIQKTSSNVGIGTTAPAHKLDVTGDIGMSGNMYMGVYSLFYSSNGFWHGPAFVSPTAESLLTIIPVAGRGVQVGANPLNHYTYTFGVEPHANQKVFGIWAHSTQTEDVVRFHDSIGNMTYQLTQDSQHNFTGKLNVAGRVSGILGFDRLQGAGVRYGVTFTNFWYSNVSIFDGSHSTGASSAINAATSGVIEIDFNPFIGWTANTDTGYTYPGAQLVISFYGSNYATDITVEVYRPSGGTDGWYTIKTVTGNTATVVPITIGPSTNYIKKIKLTMSNASVAVKIDGISMFPTDPQGINEMQVIPRYASEALILAATSVEWKDTAWTTRTKINYNVADGGSAVGYLFDTTNALSTSGAKIASFGNNGTEKAYIDKDGNINAVGVYTVDGVQVVGNRVVDARCDDAISSGDATTDGVIDALRDAMITHGLIAAS